MSSSLVRLSVLECERGGLRPLFLLLRVGHYVGSCLGDGGKFADVDLCELGFGVLHSFDACFVEFECFEQCVFDGVVHLV